MKTRINLYLPHLRPVKERLSLKQTSAYAVIVLSFMVIFCLGLSYVNSSINAENLVLNKQLMSEEKSLKDKANQLAALTTNSPLLKDIERVKSKINEKKKVLSVLKREFVDNAGFYALFNSLSTIKMDNVWLTHISANGGQLNFGGSALKSRDIPRWVNALQTAPVFSGEKFSSLSLEREDEVIHFTLHNNPDFLVKDKE